METQQARRSPCCQVGPVSSNEVAGKGIAAETGCHLDLPQLMTHTEPMASRNRRSAKAQD